METGTEIAIVGMAGRFPGASHIAALWPALLEGRHLVGSRSPRQFIDVSQEHRVEAEPLLEGADCFDAAFFGVSSREAASIDPQHRIFLEAAYHALEDGGWTASDASASVGVFGGVSPTLYGNHDLVANAGSVVRSLPHFIGVDKDYLTTRVSHLLGLRGPSVAVHCACSTSLVAIHLATRALLAGECAAALAGGATVMAPRRPRDLFVPGAMLSPDGSCRAFDSAANGTIFAEGVGMVLLMRLRDAVAQRRNIYGVILGSAVNNDGDPTVGFTAPSLDGQIRVVRQAQLLAGVSAKDIGLIEAHGTGTVLGDAIEITALQRVFGSAAPGSCGLGSIKTNIGHLAAAAGVAGLIKATLAVRHGLIPPTLHFTAPNPDLDLEAGPFFVNTEVRPWSDADRPRIAGVSSFGVGGTNAHLIVGQPPAPSTARRARRHYVIRASGKSEAAAESARAALESHFLARPELELAAAACTQVDRADFEYRLAAAGEDAVGIAKALGAATPRRSASEPPKVVFMFPGQGAQRPGMARELYETEPTFRRHLDDCFALASNELPDRLRVLLLDADPEDSEAQAALRETELAQPALFVLEYSLARTLQDCGVAPSALIGHSVGELVAAAVSGSVSLEAALKLVCCRGKLMSAAPRGSMLSIAADAGWVMGRLPDNLDLAAKNAPGQVVVAGESAALAAFEATLATEGVASQRLHTSHAFHSRMMNTCLAPFRAAVAEVEIGEPMIPVVSNVTGAFADAGSRSPDYWASQIREPVDFQAGLQTLIKSGADLFLEVGPGQALTGLCRSTATGAELSSFINCLPDPRRGVDEGLTFERALAACWVAGVPVRWRDHYADERLTRTSLPGYPFQHRRYWIEPEFGAAAEKKKPVREWVYSPQWARTFMFPARPDGARGAKLLVAAKDEAEGRALLSCWQGYGGDGVVWLADETDFPGALPGMLDSWFPDLVVDLRPLRDPPASPRDLVSPSLPATDRLLGYLIDRAPGRRLEVFLCCTHAAAPLPGERVSPTRTTFEAYATVAVQEHPEIRCKVLDLPAKAGMAELGRIVLSEHVLADREPLVAFREGERYVRRFDPAPPHLCAIEDTVLKKDGVYLLIGGTGHVGLMLAEQLAENYGARLALTGRRALPPPTQWAKLANDPDVDPGVRERLRKLIRIAARSPQLWIASVNAESYDDLADLRREVVTKFGRLDGVLFLSGVLEPSQTASGADPAAWNAVMGPKATGVANLAAAFADSDGPAFIMIFSSISTVLGGIGHFAYAAANQYANAVVHNQHAGGDKRWISIGWDRWQGTGSGISGLNGERLEELAISAIEGGEALARLLALPPLPQVIVSTHDFETRRRLWRSYDADTQAEEDVRHERPSLPTPFTPPEGEVESYIAVLWQDLLGLDKVGRNDDFFALGGHSLLGVKMIGRLREALAVGLSLRETFDNPTVAHMAVLIEQRLAEAIEALSDEEAAQLLDRLAT